MPPSLRSRLLVAETLDVLGDLPAAMSNDRRVGVDIIPPAVLTPSQTDLANRVREALDARGAAFLAASVGLGKTWIALDAVTDRAGPVAVIGPAGLKRQWLETARLLTVPITYTSIEGVSRGSLPPPASRVVLIDEAHRLRNSGTRRRHHLLPWLAGRLVLFISGTPIVNHPRDLIGLLRLALPDDALRLDGIRSLDALADRSFPPEALARLVLREATPMTVIPIRRHLLPPLAAEENRGQHILESLDRLVLGETPAIRRLVRTVLLDAAASSDAAWHLSLRRYRSLLLHAREAGALSRKEIRAFIGTCPDQGVLWELVRSTASGPILPHEDLEQIEQILSTAPRDAAWTVPLVERTRRAGPTLLFTRHLATLEVMRRALGPTTAWVSGLAAGIGDHRLPRGTVLAAFGPGRASWYARRHLPESLVLTDVGSEGLDLQGAHCVIHLDLPWHETGLVQRTGRVARLGQRASHVVEVLRLPSRALQTALDIVQISQQKGARARRWIDQLASPCAPSETALHSVLAEYERFAVAALSCGRQMGEIGLGFARGTGEWRVVECAVIHHLGAEGHLRQEFLPGPLHPALREAITEATAPPLVSHADLVERVLTAAHSAARLRQRDQLSSIDALLHAASRNQSLAVEAHLARHPVSQLLSESFLTHPPHADQIVSYSTFIPVSSTRD